MKAFRTRVSTFRVDNNGIIHKKVVEGVNVSLEDIDEDQEMLVRLAKGKRFWYL